MKIKALLLGILLPSIIFSQNIKDSKQFSESAISGLSFRSVGPALTSGRIGDIAVDPKDDNVWYIAAASGGVWKTDNHGVTFTSIFDNYGSFSISCIKVGQKNSNLIWVGSGENNNQRSVSYGDGVYKSLDGGKTFTNMGLKNSEHIGNIVIDPNDENIVWVAAYGPLWKEGGERGIYKTIDGGKTWNRVFFISDNTGFSDIVIDPSNPLIMYATAHQRRRHEWTYIGGGPESGIYKSYDGGKTWIETANGLPKNEMGRIGIAVSNVDPNFVYAIVEGKDNKGGFYRSTNKGENWEKMSGFSTSGNYYQEIFCDPINKDKVFIMDTWLSHTIDGGKTIISTGEDKKHVDNHCIWINPKNPNHWLVGCDGGLYETYNHAKDWSYYDNLPIIQFYKVATDNALPFYNIYGGTQDNNSLGGPSSTISSAGILNSDWFITWGGDGFESAIDPKDPNIVYAQAQYGALVRYDKISGQKVYIQPFPKKGEKAFRWNWDSPLLISPHDNKTLYFAANKLFKSNNRGDDWETISPDLTQQIDRNKLKVMGQVWSIDAVMKNQSTSIYGNIVALDESPIKKGLLYVGTDDGLIQVSNDGGHNWLKYQTFVGVPTNTRVNMITASLFDENVAYAVFNNHRSGDFKPYVLKTNDKGKTWINITGNLPIRGSVYCIKQDFVDSKLLFVGTEFGVYFTTDEGKNWTKIDGLPTIAVYDLDIQKRETDLVAATFGRGFYVLDNYSPLRNLNKDNLDKKAYLFPIKEALLYVPSSPFGLVGTGTQGANLWNTKNRDFGAVFLLNIKDEFKSLKQIRTEKESKLEKEKKDNFYPSIEELNKENKEQNPQLLWIISNSEGKEVRKLISNPNEGMNKMVWDLRSETTIPISLEKHEVGRYESASVGQFVAEGNYSLTVYLLKNGEIENLISKTDFSIKNLNNHAIVIENKDALNVFRKDVTDLIRVVRGSDNLLNENKEKLDLMEHAIMTYPGTNLAWLKEVKDIKFEIEKCEEIMYGNQLLAKYEFEVLPGIQGRLGMIEGQITETTTEISKSQQEHLKLIQELYQEYRIKLNAIITRINEMDKKLVDASIPYIKGQTKDWKIEKD